MNEISNGGFMKERDTLIDLTDWKSLRLLIVDDEEDLLQLLVDRFERKGCQVIGLLSPVEVSNFLSTKAFDIGIYDINLPRINGVELLGLTKEVSPNMEIIMLTGHGTVETAIETMKLGAYDYLRKPYALTELEVTVAKAWEKKKLKEANDGLKHALVNQVARDLLLPQNQTFSINGKSPVMKEILELTRRLADRSVPVLIHGESGTGKELIAKALHFWGTRADQPFIAINAGALPETLLESELFGHVKGAFTGAINDKKGLVEVADQGTLFLDEIGEMPLNLQVKLLRFLESQEFRRIGDSRLHKVNVRVVTATNRILEEEVAKGTFRQDLFFRLNVIKLNLPPLRDRLEDIPLLISHFLCLYGKGKDVSISQEGMKALLQYGFPGNVRELSHMIERGLILAKDRIIEARDLVIPELTQNKKCFGEEKQLLTLLELEKRHIANVLDECKGNKTHAARILGISVRNLYRKIEEYQIII